MLYVLLLVLLSAPTLVPSSSTHSPRWLVKTLADADTVHVRFDSIVRSTIREQRSLPAAEVGGGTRRLASETTCYEITCDLIAIKRELDGDYHLVVQEPDTLLLMIFELPNPELPEVAATSRAHLYAEAKRFIDSVAGDPPLLIERRLKKPIRLTFTGIGFYDTRHLIPQMGMLPNRRELHPILSVRSGE